MSLFKGGVEYRTMAFTDHDSKSHAVRGKIDPFNDVYTKCGLKATNFEVASKKDFVITCPLCK